MIRRASAPPSAGTSRAKAERSLAHTIITGAALNIAFASVAVITGSLTLIAELARSCILIMVDIVTLFALRLVNRNKLTRFDFGYSKIPEITNFILSLALMSAAVLVSINAAQSLGADKDTISPFDMTIAASMASIKTLYNALAAHSAHTVLQEQPSELLRGQYHGRMVRFYCSSIVLGTLTLAAIANDPLVAGVLDALGALFVTVVMIFVSAGLLKGSLYSLLDRGLSEREIATIRISLEDALGPLFDVVKIRSRHTAELKFIDIEIIVPSGETVAVIDNLRSRITTILSGIIGDCEVSIHARSASSRSFEHDPV